MFKKITIIFLSIVSIEIYSSDQKQRVVTFEEVGDNAIKNHTTVTVKDTIVLSKRRKGPRFIDMKRGPTQEEKCSLQKEELCLDVGVSSIALGCFILGSGLSSDGVTNGYACAAGASLIVVGSIMYIVAKEESKNRDHNKDKQIIDNINSRRSDGSKADTYKINMRYDCEPLDE